MPELPDIELYLFCLRQRILGRRLLKVRLLNPFVLRTVTPQPKGFEGQEVQQVHRIGKRVAIELEDENLIVIHLMISGRFRWNDGLVKGAGKIGHAIFEFDPGSSLILTEASSKKRASIHLLQGLANLKEEGLDVLTCTDQQFKEALKAENRTLKRALTNPRRFSGIGNAYSDEILFHAKLSPVRLTSSLKEEEVKTLRAKTKETLETSRDKLKEEFKTKFPGPGDVTAFRPDFAVHGRFGLPCPVCGQKIQRVQYAENQTNYCAQCQNEGRLLADRSLSRLLKADWPKTLEEMEA